MNNNQISARTSCVGLQRAPTRKLHFSPKTHLRLNQHVIVWNEFDSGSKDVIGTVQPSKPEPNTQSMFANFGLSYTATSSHDTDTFATKHEPQAAISQLSQDPWCPAYNNREACLGSRSYVAV